MILNWPPPAKMMNEIASPFTVPFSNLFFPVGIRNRAGQFVTIYLEVEVDLQHVAVRAFRFPFPPLPFRSAALAIVKHTIITIALNTSLIPAILFRQGG